MRRNDLKIRMEEAVADIERRMEEALSKTARTAKREKYSTEEKTKPAGPAMDDNARSNKEFRGG